MSGDMGEKRGCNTCTRKTGVLTFSLPKSTAELAKCSADSAAMVTTFALSNCSGPKCVSTYRTRHNRDMGQMEGELHVRCSHL